MACSQDSVGPVPVQFGHIVACSGQHPASSGIVRTHYGMFKGQHTASSCTVRTYKGLGHDHRIASDQFRYSSEHYNSIFIEDGFQGSLNSYLHSGDCLNTVMPSFQHGNSHCKDKTVSRPPYPCNGKPYTWKDGVCIKIRHRMNRFF